MFEAPAIDWNVILPFVIVAGWGILLMVVDLFVSEDKRGWAPWLTIVGLFAALAVSVSQWNNGGGTFTAVGETPMVMVDNFAVFLNVTLVLAGIFSLLISINFLENQALDKPEYYMLMLFSLSGMMLMGMANDLILIFIALELLSIPLYILSGFAWPKLKSEESALKYFLLGAFSSSIFVFGIALTYGATGTTSLPEIFAQVSVNSALGVGAIAFLLVGLAFKVAAAPFHMWTPDVYEGAPTSVTAFMSVGAKVAGFAALLRILTVAFPHIGDAWVGAVAILATLTLIVGNVAAIAQSNIKRMLAYSSIAHAGYILIAVASSVNSPDGVSAALFYMFAYLFSNLGAFAIVIAMEKKDDLGTSLDDYKGLWKRSPAMALAMAVFMLSLAGIPPTGGFVGKLFVFRTAVEANLVWLAVVGVITAVVSTFYYLRVVYLMFMFEGEAKIEAQPALRTAVALMVLITLLIGLLPSVWFELAQQAGLSGIHLLAGG
ncbi:MAG: NADH-quinone oxidoreductase subunit N [Chloroflexi bacterium]|nr:NADH-quinone oxidoreductase subunit N [Chloroflexota bacterium]MBK6711081.1 NADH-quinone oxidoreductase subunit N [Chloroflexota bacterium]MBK7178012.1 NADH-quinone oxidoreductase subunit N [Chloroflexota bacterium]MBK7916042.1 NADH-quinone oxidoreductase subunit N [Chloroflexota bacterium]MBP6803536.1 NADH-quinone oxidoreductase subunit N [Chloroflexota bacterium]